MVSYRETVTSSSTRLALKKSSNKLNRLWFRASPLSNELVESLESLDAADTVTTAAGVSKRLAQMLSRDFGWSKHRTQRIWAVSPESDATVADMDSGPTCVLINETHAVQIPNDVKSNIIAAFHEVVGRGVIAGSS